MNFICPKHGPHVLKGCFRCEIENDEETRRREDEEDARNAALIEKAMRPPPRRWTVANSVVPYATRLAARDLLERHKELLDAFTAVATRKFLAVDEYGDPDVEAVQTEVNRLLRKIEDREVGNGLPPTLDSVRVAAAQELLQRIADSANRASENNTPRNAITGKMSGIEFESYVAGLLRGRGYRVRTTPTSGDQGADLVALKGGRTFVIQTKRYSGAVGNSAVQEVVAALKHWGGDEAWVVTNSTFTAYARALAQSNSVRLIDGTDLTDPDRVFGNE